MKDSLQFYKFHGAGNDFIVIDERVESYNLTAEAIAAMCNRHTGIGADGLMLLQSSDVFDFNMKYYNADGYEGSMCGNGGRCIAAFAYYLGLAKKTMDFDAIDGKHHAEILKESGKNWEVRISLQDVRWVENYQEDFLLDTGSPHYVRFVNDLAQVDIVEEGKKIRFNKLISRAGVNVNFVEEYADYLFVKTYERGVEDLTLSCGTGVTAVALAQARRLGLTKMKQKIKTLGGELIVSYSKLGDGYSDVQLQGPATLVFSGMIIL